MSDRSVGSGGVAAKSASHKADFSLGVHGARGLFCFAVLIYHVHNSGLPSWELPPALYHFLTSLKFGVELFFAISGFVVLGSMKRAGTPFEFIVDRATRIFPVLWVVTIVVMALYFLRGDWPISILNNSMTYIYMAANLLALPGIFSFPLFHPAAWTISYEFCFYFVCFFYLLQKKYFKADFPLPIFIVGLVIVSFYPRGAFFLSGLIVYGELIKIRAVRKLSEAPALLLLVFFAAWQFAAVSVADDLSPTDSRFPTLPNWDDPLAILAAVIAFAAATLALQGIVDGRGWFAGAFLTSRQMLWLGTVSYSLYLWHPIVLGIVKVLMKAAGIPDLVGEWSQVVFFCLATPPSLVVAWLSQVFLERRVTTALRRFWNEKSKKIGAAHTNPTVVTSSSVSGVIQTQDHRE